MRKPQPRTKPEPTIALVNIVFLMLVFFMVAGTLSPPIDPDVTLVDTRDLEGREPQYALVITASGALRYRGDDVLDVQPYLSDRAFEAGTENTTAHILPDRDAPASVLLQVARDLRAGGAEKVMIMTEKALQ